MNSSTAAARSRKNRSSSARGGRGKVVERQVPADGVYTNHRFMQSVGALVGLPVLIQTRTNDTIEGVFTTFSPNFDLVLDMAHPVSRTDPSIINPETIKRKMIFSAADIVTIKVTNVDLEYATKEGFAVDQVISRFNGQVTERPLEPWQGDSNAEDNLALGEESSNGWDVDDMFRKNEEKYGVTTSYTPEMEGYTTPLNRRNTREYREREAKAQRIAAEIMSAPATQARSEAENGDEEEKYSAVVRPAEQTASGEGGGGGATKYVPPMFRKKNQNAGKLMRSTPPPGQGNRYSGSNPPTPTSPSCAGPPQVSSGSHSPIGGPNGPGGASPGYPSQQGPPPSTHSPSPTAHPPPYRHNSHSHPSDSKLNGDAKGSSYDRRNHDGPMSEMGRENHHNDTSSKQDHHGRQHHSEVQQQKPQQKPPPSHQHTGHMPPMGQGDHRKQAPLEQREPRKQRTNKEEQIADLKRFSQDFKLTEQNEKKAQNQQHQQPPTQQMQQPQEPPQQAAQQHAQQTQQQPRQHPPPQQQQPPPQAQQPPPPPQTQQPPPQQPQQQPPPQPQQPPTSHQPPSHMPPQQSQQRQTPPVSTPMTQGPPQNVSQSPHHPQNPPTMAMSSVAEVSKPHEEVEKLSSAVSQSKLNPNAKEFVLNPHAKPFSPRSPSTTTPPRPHTPQTPQIPTNQPPQMAGCPTVGFPQAMVSAAYVMAASQPFAVQQSRFPKRVPIGSNQRPEYTSPMQVAAATGQPILAPAPMNSQPQAITAVQIPQNIMPQTPQPYQQYPGMPMMVRFPHAGMQMVTAMVPTSNIYSQAADSQQQSQQHQTMYMTPSIPPHQPHPAHTPGPGPQPTQPPTPQNPGGGGGPPNMPNQPPTPGPTPPQPLIYSHMGGQPSLPQHLPQHSPHTAQSPHAHQYPGQSAAAAAAAAAAAGGHHGGPGQQMQTQMVIFPPNMAPHMMHPSGPPPHSATAHIPSSMAGFTPTSSTVQHMPSTHIQYIQGTPGTHGHHVPLIRHSQ